MSEITVTPATRREVWLSIALAVAHDGLPEPEDFTTNQFVSDEGRQYRLLHLTFDSHTAALAWMRWLGVDDAHIRSHDRPDLGNRYVTNDLAQTVRVGWVWSVSGKEPLPTARERELAAEVFAAILTPDAAPVGTAS